MPWPVICGQLTSVTLLNLDLMKYTVSTYSFYTPASPHEKDIFQVQG